MKTRIAVVASACLMSLAFQAHATEHTKNGMSKDQMMKKCADRAGMSKDEATRCDDMMKPHRTKKGHHAGKDHEMKGGMTKHDGMMQKDGTMKQGTTGHDETMKKDEMKNDEMKK